MLRLHATVVLRRLLRDADGTTAIEYGIIAAGIGGAVCAVVWNIGSEVKTTLYDKLTSLF